MSENPLWAKILRFVAIVLMGLTGGFTLLGAVGTSCVALAPTDFGENMARLAPFQWLYVLFVVVGIGLGIAGIWTTVLLVRRRENGYRASLAVLAAGLVIGFIHIVVSRLLRGSSMPVDAVVFTTLLTLIVFLLFRIPSLRQTVDFVRGDAQSHHRAGGAAAIVVGLLAIGIQVLMGPTHTWEGINYAAAFDLSMKGIALFCLLVAVLAWLPAGRIRVLLARWAFSG